MKYQGTIVLGGGGHTKEMIEMLKLSPIPMEKINLVCSSCDIHSVKMCKGVFDSTPITVFEIARPNDVLSGYSLWKMLRSLFTSLYVCFFVKSDFLLCNGPGLCVSFCIAHKILHPLTPIFYVESVTRVSSLSLTGKILQWFVDEFIVQSKGLEKASYPIRKYCRIFDFSESSSTIDCKKRAAMPVSKNIDFLRSAGYDTNRPEHANCDYVRCGCVRGGYYPESSEAVSTDFSRLTKDTDSRSKKSETDSRSKKSETDCRSKKNV